MTEQDRAVLLRFLTGGIFFSPERIFTKRCIEQIVGDIPFNESDLDALDSIEVCAPSAEALAIIVPPQAGPCVWLDEALEGETTEVAKTKIAWALASAAAIAKGLGPDQVVSDAAYTIRRWGFPIREGAAA